MGASTQPCRPDSKRAARFETRASRSRPSTPADRVPRPQYSPRWWARRTRPWYPTARIGWYPSPPEWWRSCNARALRCGRLSHAFLPGGEATHAGPLRRVGGATLRARPRARRGGISPGQPQLEDVTANLRFASRRIDHPVLAAPEFLVDAQLSPDNLHARLGHMFLGLLDYQATAVAGSRFVAGFPLCQPCFASPHIRCLLTPATAMSRRTSTSCRSIPDAIAAAMDAVTRKSAA